MMILNLISRYILIGVLALMLSQRYNNNVDDEHLKFTTGNLIAIAVLWPIAVLIFVYYFIYPKK
jgi:hypothetical protein